MTRTSSAGTHLILTVHGIHTYGYWQLRLQEIVAKKAAQYAGRARFEHYKYGIMSVFVLVIPVLREIIVARFRRQLETLLLETKPERIDIVAHSFGTYLIARAIKKLGSNSAIRIHTLIFAASVIKPSNGLNELPVARVVNDCGLRDIPLLFAPFVVGLGMAGRLGIHGFLDSHQRNNRFFRFGHSGYFKESEWGDENAFMTRWWVPLLLSDATFEQHNDRPPKPSLFDHVVSFYGDNPAVTPILYVGLLFIVLFPIWSFHNEAILEREAALIAQSRSLTEAARQESAVGDYATAALLALEGLNGSNRPYVAETEAALYASLEGDREFGVLSNDVTAGVSSWTESAGSAQGILTTDPVAGFFLNHTALGQHMISMLGGVRSAFSPDGRLIATWANDGARIWETKTGRLLAVLKPKELGVESVAFSPDAARIVAAMVFRPTASIEEVSRLISQNAEVSIHGIELRGHTRGVTAVSFSPDGREVLTASWDGTVRIWDSAGGQLLHTFFIAKEGVSHALFSPDGRRIIAASGDATARELIHIFDAANGREIARLTGFSELVFTLAISPDGRYIAATSIDGTARLWNAEDGASIGLLTSAGAFGLAFSHDGSRVVVGLRNGSALVCGTDNGAEVGVLTGHKSAVLGAAFNADGTLIATASIDRSVRLWNAKTFALEGMLRGHLRGVFGVAFSPDGLDLTSMAFDGTARLWELRTNLLKTNGASPEIAQDSEKTPGHRMISIGNDYSIHVSDARYRTEGHVLMGHKGTVYMATFSPDGMRIASASYDGTARIWDANTGEQIEVLQGHEGPVLSATFSPDGRRVATGSADRTARVWDLAAGEPVAIMSDLNYEVAAVRFSADGTELATLASDGRAENWRVFPATADIVRFAESVAPRCLTPRQRVQYSLGIEPPSWCIEKKKWPYDTPKWQEWLIARNSGKPMKLPDFPF